MDTYQRKLKNVERVSLLKVPIDLLKDEELPGVVEELIASNETRHIVLLSLQDLLRARRSGDYRSYVLSAALVLPVSRSLQRGIKFLHGKPAIRHMPFDFVIRMLSALEHRSRSLYLLGAKQKTLQTAEKNVRITFPGLRIVGRYKGYFKKQQEQSIITGIRKASPSLLLTGSGIKGKERWIAKHEKELGPGIKIWVSDLLDIFAEKKKRPSRKVFELGLEGILFCLARPWRLTRLFSYLYFNLLLAVYKVFKRG